MEHPPRPCATVLEQGSLGGSWAPGGLTFPCPMQVHQSTRALRWIMQALQGRGFGSGEDVPPMGKRSMSPS